MSQSVICGHSLDVHAQKEKDHLAAVSPDLNLAFVLNPLSASFSSKAILELVVHTDQHVLDIRFAAKSAASRAKAGIYGIAKGAEAHVVVF